MEDYCIDLKEAPSEYVGEYIELKLFKRIRFTAFAETNGILILEYSNAGVVVDMSVDIRLQASKWVSVALEPKMAFARIHLKVEEGRQCKVQFTGEKLPPVSTGWLW